MIYTAFILILATACAHGSYGGGYGYNRRQDNNFCLTPNSHGLIVKPIKSTYSEGDTIEISCEVGYKFNNRQTNSTCRVFPGFFGGHGVFMPGIFPDTCEELPLCRPPRASGLIVGNVKDLYEEGENITISCKEGFKLIGSDTYTCKVKMSYYGRFASFGENVRKACQEIRNCRPPMQDGLIFEPVKRIYKPGENISLACEEDYELTVYETSTCQSTGYFHFERMEKDGDQKMRDDYFIYSNQVCSKKAKCKAPDYHGMIVTPSKDSYEAGDKITISCGEGYELKGSNTTVCGYEDSWDVFSYIRRMHGYGTFVPEISFRTCSKIQVCNKPRGVGLVISPAKDFYNIGEEVKISCEDGYEQLSLSTATCKRYKFGYITFNVRLGPKSCRKIPQCSAMKAQEGLIMNPSKEKYDIGETVELSCEEGYRLTEFNSTTCSIYTQHFLRHGTRLMRRTLSYTPWASSGFCEIIPTEKPTEEPEPTPTTPDSQGQEETVIEEGEIESTELPEEVTEAVESELSELLEEENDGIKKSGGI